MLLIGLAAGSYQAEFVIHDGDVNRGVAALISKSSKPLLSSVFTNVLLKRKRSSQGMRNFFFLRNTNQMISV